MANPAKLQSMASVHLGGCIQLWNTSSGGAHWKETYRWVPIEPKPPWICQDGFSSSNPEHHCSMSSLICVDECLGQEDARVKIQECLVSLVGIGLSCSQESPS